MPSWAPLDGSSRGSLPSNSGGSSGGGSRPAVGGSAAPTTPGRRGGIALDFRRGKTTKNLLQIEWTYPVWKPVQIAQGEDAKGTVAGNAPHALPPAEAYEYVADKDTRPLLVLRECDLCKGTDHALLDRSLDNEQTMLLTRWFHCIKLPVNVVGKEHPFTSLFVPAADGRVPHLFFSDPDGGNRTELFGDQSQTQLWEIMFSYLERNYVGDPKKVVKELRGLLSQFDKVDGLEQELKGKLDKEIEKNSSQSPRAVKMKEELAALATERKALLVREKELRELARKPQQAPAAPRAPAEGGTR